MEDPEVLRLLGGPPRTSIEDILGNPRLPQARKAYLDRFLEVYGGDPFLVRLLLETGRFLVFFVLVVLESAQDEARRETWVTVGLLKRTLEIFGLASGRQIDHLVARLCEVGYMESRPSPKDRRVRILSATEKLRAHDRDWLAAHYAPLPVLYPERDYSLVMQRDLQFQLAHRRVSFRLLPFGAKLLADQSEMLIFLSRAGGYMVIVALLQAAMAADDHLNAAVSYGDVGDRFGISRTQVRDLLVQAEELGLVRLHERGGRRVEILPRLWTVYDRSMAAGQYGADIAYLAASRMIAQGAMTGPEMLPA